MATLYKLTTQDHKTRPGELNETTWSEGFTLETTGRGNLCGAGFIHAYTHPLLAVLLNPIHANYQNPVLWECEGDVAAIDSGLKVGCTRLTTIKQIPLPKITTEQRTRFGLLCALKVWRCPEFVSWADAWLNGKNRSVKATWAAEAEEAAAAAEEAAATAEEAAAAAWATWATEAAAAAWAAAWAARAANNLDLIALAEKAVQCE